MPSNLPADLDPRIVFELDGDIATITMDQPAKRNAVAPSMWDAIAALFDHCSKNPAVRVVVLTGRGEAFCAGTDLAEIDLENDIASGLSRLRGANRMILAIRNCDKPVIAACRGSAVGVGWSLALACDFTLAATTAKFGGGFVKVGLVPDGGSIYFLSRLLGEARAKEIAYTSRVIPAPEAVDLGLVLEAVPGEELDARVAAFAGQLAKCATTSVGLAKRLFRHAMGPTLEMYLEQEELAQVCSKRTDDFAEGVAAFREKRAARFTGR